MTLSRQLGLWSATCLVVASMIGTGVFTTSGLIIEALGSPWSVLLVWVLGGVLAALGALSYGALARRIPESGGEYLFLSRTLHPAAGYVAGWISLLVGFSAPLAAVAYGLGEYVGAWFPGYSPKAIGSGAVLLFALVHGIRVAEGARIQNWIVLIKVIFIVAFIGFVFCVLPAVPPFHLGSAPVAAYGVQLVWVSFSYSGWNAAVYIGGEISEPERNLPRALLLGTGVVALLYLGLNAAFVFSAEPGVLAGKLQVGRIAAEALGGAGLANGVTLVIVLALVTSVSSLIMAGPRVYAQMARDGYLPGWLASTSGPPRGSIALQVGIALMLLWIAKYQQLLTYIGFTLGLSTAGTVLGLVKVRLAEGEGFVVPGWPWVPGFFLAGVYAITLSTVAQRPSESWIGLATIAAGWLAWRLTRGRSIY